MEIGHALARVGSRLCAQPRLFASGLARQPQCYAPSPMGLDPAHVSVTYHDVQPVLLSAIS